MSVGQSGVNHSQPPLVIMDELVYQKIMHFVHKSDVEVSGLGKLIVQPDGNIRIIEAILLPQRNTSTTTDIEGADVGKAAFLLKDTPGELRFWWHSHVNMGVFWSGTDLQTIRLLAQGGWYVSTVFNKRHETKTCISMNDPFPLMFDNVALSIERSLPAELVAEWNAEYEEKVTNVLPKFKPASYQGQGRQAQGRSVTKPVYTPEERAELARLARLMMEDEDDETGPFPGIGSDGVYGDVDWPGSSFAKEHDKSASTSPQDVLLKRDELEAKLERYEARANQLREDGKEIPVKLERAIETVQEELDEVEDELDVLEAHGMIQTADRYSHAHFAQIGE